MFLSGETFITTRVCWICTGDAKLLLQMGWDAGEQGCSWSLTGDPDHTWAPVALLRREQLCVLQASPPESSPGGSCAARSSREVCRVSVPAPTSVTDISSQQMAGGGVTSKVKWCSLRLWSPPKDAAPEAPAWPVSPQTCRSTVCWETRPQRNPVAVLGTHRWHLQQPGFQLPALPSRWRQHICIRRHRVSNTCLCRQQSLQTPCGKAAAALGREDALYSESRGWKALWQRLPLKGLSPILCTSVYYQNHRSPEHLMPLPAPPATSTHCSLSAFCWVSQPYYSNIAANCNKTVDLRDSPSSVSCSGRLRMTHGDSNSLKWQFLPNS